MTDPGERLPGAGDGDRSDGAVHARLRGPARVFDSVPATWTQPQHLRGSVGLVLVGAKEPRDRSRPRHRHSRQNADLRELIYRQTTPSIR